MSEKNVDIVINRSNKAKIVGLLNELQGDSEHRILTYQSLIELTQRLDKYLFIDNEISYRHRRGIRCFYHELLPNSSRTYKVSHTEVTLELRTCWKIVKLKRSKHRPRPTAVTEIFKVYVPKDTQDYLINRLKKEFLLIEEEGDRCER